MYGCALFGARLGACVGCADVFKARVDELALLLRQR